MDATKLYQMGALSANELRASFKLKPIVEYKRLWLNGREMPSWVVSLVQWWSTTAETLRIHVRCYLPRIAKWLGWWTPPLTYPAEWLLDLFNGGYVPMASRNWLKEADSAESHAIVCRERAWLFDMGRNAKNSFWRFRHELLSAKPFAEEAAWHAAAIAVLNREEVC